MISVSPMLQQARDYEREHTAVSGKEERPLFHLTPPVGWMNDPNGFCRYQGQYHLFFQYHPYSLQWGPMHWGHAVSDDLLRWTYRPCALAPDTETDAGGCYSGSAVETPDGKLLLCYTGVQGADASHDEIQAQCIAVGDGENFEKSPLNPVIRRTHLPEGFSASDFRDPRIWRTADGYCLAAGGLHEQREGAALLLESPDALNWHFAGELDASGGECGGMWECPDFFELDGTHVLLVSPVEMRARGEFHAGAGTVAILGDFDSKSRRFTRKQMQPVDHGLDFYAPQTVSAPDGRRIMIGWMDNWQNCKEAPRVHSWYGQMSMPRELYVRGGRLCQRPVREISSLWQDTVVRERTPVQEAVSFDGIRGRMMDLSLTLCPEGSACRRFTLLAARDGDHETRITWDRPAGELIFDRSAAGSRRDIAHIRRVPARERDGRLSLRLLLDRESVELFINGGERTITALIPSPPEADQILLSADAPIHVSAEAHHLSGSAPAMQFLSPLRMDTEA